MVVLGDVVTSKNSLAGCMASKNSLARALYSRHSANKQKFEI